VVKVVRLMPGVPSDGDGVRVAVKEEEVVVVSRVATSCCNVVVHRP
jgi:hypothetical protein